MDDPFELPARIREIRVGKATATIVRDAPGRAPVVTSPASMDPLASALQYLKGVGPRRAADLQRVGLATVEDLLYRFPTRYEDRGAFRTIASLRPGMVSSVLGEVISCGIKPTRRPRFKIFEMPIAPGRCARCGSTSRSSPMSSIPISASSCAASSSSRRTACGCQNPQYEVIKAEGDEEEGQGDIDALHTGRIVPIYEKTGTLTTKMQRVLVHQALAHAARHAAGSAARGRPPAPAVDRQAPRACRRALSA